MSPALSRRTLEAVIECVENCQGRCMLPGGHAAILVQLRAAMRPKRSVTLARKRVKAKKATRTNDWRQVRTQVFRRAQPDCEACGQWAAGHLEPDHFLGGNGRRKAMESVGSVWALCRLCHHKKGANIPNAAFWLNAFLRHSAKHGFTGPAQREARARLESLQLQGRTGEG